MNNFSLIENYEKNLRTLEGELKNMLRLPKKKEQNKPKQNKKINKPKKARNTYSH